jgi:hypothetical protein
MQGKIYTPREAAEKLGISVAMLRYLRNTGRVQGTNVGNTTLYSEEQLSKIDLTPRKSGPKTEEEKKIEAQKKQIEEDDLSSMMLMENGQPQREREAVA